MALFRAVLLSLTVTAILVKLAIGKNHTVGGASGWDLSSNLQSWAAGESFHVGDNLIFKYSPPHDVIEVTKADYDSCQATSAIKVYTDLNTVITLNLPGNRYFICGFPEHCGQGMKLLVQTLATSTAIPPTATSPSTLPNVAAPPLPKLASPPPHAISNPPSTLPKITTPPLPSIAPLANPPSTLPNITTPPLPGIPPLTPHSLPPLGSAAPKVFSILPPSNSPASGSSTTPPPPSSANRGHLLSKLTTGIWFGMSMLLAL